MKLRRWEYGIAVIDEQSGRPGPIDPVTDEDEARLFVIQNYPWAVLYRRPQPKPWQLVPLKPTKRA